MSELIYLVNSYQLWFLFIIVVCECHWRRAKIASGLFTGLVCIVMFCTEKGIFYWSVLLLLLFSCLSNKIWISVDGKWRRSKSILPEIVKTRPAPYVFVSEKLTIQVAPSISQAIQITLIFENNHITIFSSHWCTFSNFSNLKCIVLKRITLLRERE